MNELADRVRHERLKRDWSVRAAATAGGISNTHWGNFEDYKTDLTPLVITAVAKAFGWAEDWPNTDGHHMDSLSQLRADHERLAGAVATLARVIREELQLERDLLLGDEESIATLDEREASPLRPPG